MSEKCGLNRLHRFHLFHLLHFYEQHRYYERYQLLKFDLGVASLGNDWNDVQKILLQRMKSCDGAHHGPSGETSILDGCWFDYDANEFYKQTEKLLQSVTLRLKDLALKCLEDPRSTTQAHACARLRSKLQSFIISKPNGTKESLGGGKRFASALNNRKAGNMTQSASSDAMQLQRGISTLRLHGSPRLRSSRSAIDSVNKLRSFSVDVETHRGYHTSFPTSNSDPAADASKTISLEHQVVSEDSKSSAIDREENVPTSAKRFRVSSSTEGAIQLV